MSNLILKTWISLSESLVLSGLIYKFRLFWKAVTYCFNKGGTNFFYGREFNFTGCSAFCLTIFTFCACARGEAAEVDLRLRTYMQLFEDVRDERHAPFYEYVELNLRNLKERKLSFYAGGWFRYDLKTLSNSQREMDELSYAYLRYAPFEDRSLIFHIGRHHVTEGITAGLVDGVSMRWENSRLTGFSLFGGVPTETEFDGRKADLVYGGRVFQRIERKAEFGLSFLREDNDGSRFREELGFDLWLLPLQKVEVIGRSSYSTVTDGWMEQSYTVRIFPSEKFTFSGIFTHSDFRHAFSSSTLSAFLPEFLGQSEEMTKAGGSVEYRISKDIAVGGDYLGYEYRKSGDAKYYGGNIAATTHGVSLGASIHRMAGDTERLRYTELRLYGRKIFGDTRLSVDSILLHYDAPFSGLSNAYSVNGTLEYKVTNAMVTGLSIEYLKSPDFTRDTRFLFKLAYDLRGRQR